MSGRIPSFNFIERGITIKGKGGKTRTVPINEQIAIALRRQLERTERGHKLLVPDGVPTDRAMRHNCPKAGKATAKGVAPLQTSQPQFPESFVRQTWLQYFNDYLREQHIITEEEWRKMRRQIEKN